MEDGNKGKSLVDLIKPYQEEFNQAWIRTQGLLSEGFQRQMLGIPEVYHTDSEGNQRLLSIEETIEFLEKNREDGRK